MKELIARVEKATGPDREIDAALDDILCEAKLGWEPGKALKLRTANKDAYGLYDGVRKFTASLDAVVALVERELPHSYYEICRHTPTKWLALVSTVRGAEKSTVEQKLYRATHNSAALALLLAFLRAKGEKP